MNSPEKVKIYPIKTDGKKSVEDNGTYNEEPDNQSGVSTAVIIAEIVLTVIAVTLAVIFGVSLYKPHTFEYIHTETQVMLEVGSVCMPSDTIGEADIPVPAYIPVYYDFTLPVPENSPVDLSYFSDTVFIGDSRTKGLIMYTDLTPYDFSSVGTNVKNVQNKPYIRLEDENGEFQTFTLFEALEREADNYKSIYIALGLNELGWNADNFIYSFRELISNVRSITDKPIYIQLVIPVTEYASKTTQFGITNEKAALFNDRLRAECAELELFCLDPTELFALENGTLDPAHASDGIHLNRASYSILANYYASHTVNIEAYDNTRSEDPTAFTP